MHKELIRKMVNNEQKEQKIGLNMKPKYLKIVTSTFTTKTRMLCIIPPIHKRHNICYVCSITSGAIDLANQSNPPIQKRREWNELSQTMRDASWLSSPFMWAFIIWLKKNRHGFKKKAVFFCQWFPMVD